MPFVGVILRYRANYSPKSLQLTDDDGMPKPPQADHELGSPNSFFGMIKRVYKLEVRHPLLGVTLLIFLGMDRLL